MIIGDNVKIIKTEYSNAALQVGQTGVVTRIKQGPDISDPIVSVKIENHPMPKGFFVDGIEEQEGWNFYQSELEVL